MRKITFCLVLSLFCFSNLMFAQQSNSIAEKMTANGITPTENPHRCSSDERHAQMMQDPAFAEAYNAQRASVSQAMLQKSQPACATPLVIPVVVHFQETNIPNQCMIDATIAQIDQMNSDFAGCNANAGDFCDWIDAGCDAFGGTAGGDAQPVDGSCIKFCLADQNLPTDNSLIAGGLAITTGYNANNQDADNVWQGYLNIYVGNLGGGILGFVNFLGGGGNTNTTQGASVLTSAFGAQTFAGCSGVGTGAPFDGGATLTHEVGHWFGLEHTFSDNVADTPPQNQPNYGCVTVNTGNCTSSVGSDYSGNFMDYVDDDCMFMFSEDQVIIMRNTAAAQAQWATNSISCSNVYETCVQQGACTVVCPTTVTAPYSAADQVCIVSSPSYNLPTDFSSVVLDEGGSATFLWSTGNYISAGGTAVTGAAIALPTPSGCAPVVETLYLNTGCSDGSIQEINAGTMQITIYPDPAQFAPADLVTFTDGDCNGPTFIVTPGCEPYVTVTQNGGPTFPVATGAGAVDYDVTLNYPTECCCPATASSETQSNTTTTAIPDGGGAGNQGCTTVTINSGDPVTGATVDVDATHTWVGDLVITLTSPAGTTVVLGDQPGVPGSQFGCDGDNISVTFDDAAANDATAFENACGNAPAISGAYQPVDALSSFAGESAAGTWTLCAYDNVNQDAGSITNFGLTVNTEVPCIDPVDCIAADMANYNCERRTTTITSIGIATLSLGSIFNGIPLVAPGDNTPFGGINAVDEYARTETDAFDKLDIFPTLANNVLNVRYSLSNEAMSQVNIIDINGKLMQQYSQNINDIQTMQVDVSTLPSGIYFVQMVANDIVLVEKFVKQ